MGTTLSKTRFSGGYVAVQGRLMEQARISVGRIEASGSRLLEDAMWVPLVDGDGGKALLVQFAADHEFTSDRADATIEGMLRPVNSVVARQLAGGKYVHQGIPIDRRFMLVAGGRPGALSRPLMSGTIFGLLAVALAWAMLTRNVIFMPADASVSGHAASLLDAAHGQPLLVSGKLALDAKTRRFFTNMPAVLQRMETGDTALLSAIETSTTCMGMKTQQRSGVWMLGMRPGSVTDVQCGWVFWGFKKMRAIRFRYVNSMTGTAERAVVAMPGEAAQPSYAASNATLA